VTDTINAQVETAINTYLQLLKQEPSEHEAIEGQRQAYKLITQITDCFSYGEKPRKPSAPRRGAGELSEDYRQYADALAEWEKLMAQWNAGNKERSAAITKTENACKAYLEELSGVNELPPSQAAKVKALAWDRGHSSGSSQYYFELVELMELFNAG
jgi:sulfur relay (sulfurtransferase) DsrC/TusE family protein